MHKWTPSEEQRRAECEAGRAVVANMRSPAKGGDVALIAWAKLTGRFVRIDRKSDWGNPFEMPKPERDGDRARVCALHATDLGNHPELLARLPELRGKVLGCWCHPEQCHGDTLAELVNTKGAHHA